MNIWLLKAHVAGLVLILALKLDLKANLGIFKTSSIL